MKTWSVPYWRACRGVATVEAKTAEDAEAKVEGGDFEPDPGEEQVDWNLDGAVKEER